MKPSTTAGFIALKMENPALELDDFDRLVEQYRTRVLRFLFASARDMDLAETLTQDCFLKAYKSRKSFRGDCKVNTWLIQIAVNLHLSRTIPAPMEPVMALIPNDEAKIESGGLQ